MLPMTSGAFKILLCGYLLIKRYSPGLSIPVLITYTMSRRVTNCYNIHLVLSQVDIRLTRQLVFALVTICARSRFRSRSRVVSPLGPVRMGIPPCRGALACSWHAEQTLFCWPRAAPQEYEESATSAGRGGNLELQQPAGLGSFQQVQGGLDIALHPRKSDDLIDKHPCLISLDICIASVDFCRLHVGRDGMIDRPGGR